jgi:hypothetical protein
LFERFNNKLKDIQILAVMLEPKEDICLLNLGKRYKFIGYDLFGEDGSPLINCGGIGKEFYSVEINKTGLLNDYGFAKKVQKYLQETSLKHELWAIWKYSDE